MPETWAPFRGPKLDTKSRPKLGHPLWVPTFFVVKWGLFWGLGSGPRISIFFRCPSGGKSNPLCSKHFTGCASNSLIKLIRMQIKLGRRGNNFINVFLSGVCCSETSDWQCSLMSTTANSHQSAEHDLVKVSTTRMQLPQKQNQRYIKKQNTNITSTPCGLLCIPIQLPLRLPQRL